MTNDPKNRHAKIFALLHQSEQSKRPAARAQAAAERYLDDTTADQILSHCLSSMHPPLAGKQTLKKATTRAAFFRNRQID
ncbi:MAG: hypothetical protein AB8B60_06195 [Sulfitobacter sp.]